MFEVRIDTIFTKQLSWLKPFTYATIKIMDRKNKRASKRHWDVGFFHASSNCSHVSFCRNIWCTWKVYHPCGFFHVRLTPFFWCTCTHIESNGMVYCHHESVYVFSRCLDRNTSSRNRDSWKVYRQCGFFRASSNYLIVYICIHIESSWMVYHSCEFFHVSSNW